MKLINDTLKSPDGKWSRKSLTAFAAFTLAIVYEFVLPLPLPYLALQTKEYVFITLIGLTGATLGLTVWDKSKK
jgi:hypothetical protein